MSLWAEGKKILMNEYNYGLDLHFRLKGDILPTDKIVMTIKEDLYKTDSILDMVFEKDVLKEEDGTICFDLSFTKEQSEKLPAGNYVYLLHQCRGCEIHNTFVDDGEFIVKKGDKL